MNGKPSFLADLAGGKAKAELKTVKKDIEISQTASQACSIPGLEDDVDRFCSQEATKIYDFLYLGGNLVAKNKELLLKLGITNIINAARVVCDDYFLKEGLFEYLSFELIDNASESISHFMLRTVVEIEKVRKRGGSVLVHCHQGVSRSCTLVIAYLMWKESFSFQEAFQFVKQRRSICSPNSGFMTQLMQWETKLKAVLLSPSLMVVSPHSDRDRSLVVKPFKPARKGEDDVAIAAAVAATATSINGHRHGADNDDNSHLDGPLPSNTCYILHVPENKCLYVLVGSHCENRTVVEHASITFAHWMSEYEPCYKSCEVKSILLENFASSDCEKYVMIALQSSN